MIIIESKNGELKVKTSNSTKMKSNTEVDAFVLRAQDNPTEKEISLSKQMGFTENVFGKEVIVDGVTFYLVGINPKNKKPLCFQEKGKWWSYLYVHPEGAKTHLPTLAKLMK